MSENVKDDIEITLIDNNTLLIKGIYISKMSGELEDKLKKYFSCLKPVRSVRLSKTHHFDPRNMRNKSEFRLDYLGDQENWTPLIFKCNHGGFNYLVGELRDFFGIDNE